MAGIVTKSAGLGQGLLTGFKDMGGSWFCAARVASWSPAGIRGEPERKKSSLQTNIDYNDKPVCTPLLAMMRTRSAKNVAKFWVMSCWELCCSCWFCAPLAIDKDWEQDSAWVGTVSAMGRECWRGKDRPCWERSDRWSALKERLWLHERRMNS